ncbi:MAG TPA: SpoIIE family protein phosphatase [Spirochaetota bacterium]|nr:SpoIIE family protein phosphatase [Spirochaetota bacterium]HOM38631.1 SpoIIE family protein phosphatase [Spirochaetota bacterium]HPQ49768.1 SpoIIE family protein phosphatase [Spirochaetota bacterium]
MEINEVKIPLWQLKQAQKIQLGFLPQQIKPWNCLSFSYQYHSFDPIGGDYLDFFDIKGNKKGILIADVSGHGIPASILTAMAKISFSNHAIESDSPKEILKRVNIDLCRFISGSGLYITAFLLVIDQDHILSFSSAGHPGAIYYNNKKDNFQELKTKGLFVGMFEDAWETYHEDKIQINPGDRIILYTDGIIEARDKHGVQYGIKRLEEVVKFSYALPPDIMSKMIINDVREFAKDGYINDDMSVLVIEADLSYEKFKKHYIEGKKYFESKNLKWVNEYIKAFEYNKDNYEVSFNLGKFFLKNCKYDKAEEAFLRLVKNRIVDPKLYFYLSKVYIEQKKYVKALEFLKEIEREYPMFREAVNNIAYCYYKMGKLKEAKEKYEEISRRFRGYSYYYERIIKFINNKILNIK